jgi:hypothetical protein
MSRHRQLKILAAGSWILGGVALASKAISLLSQAQTLSPHSSATLWSVVTGILIGTLKARWIFSTSYRKNLKRIEQLDNPRWWQFFRPRFFLFLATMISLGALLSSVAEGDLNRLIAVATLDISLATALLLSSPLFYPTLVATDNGQPPPDQSRAR